MSRKSTLIPRIRQAIIEQKTFGFWTPIEAPSDSISFYRQKITCRCQCGAERKVLIANLAMGSTESCGCGGSQKIKELRDMGITDRINDIPEYHVWRFMIKRCDDPGSKDFDRYGGRGIAVCEQWYWFPNFIRDMGRRPGPEFSIDRIDNCKGYSKENCRWATARKQANNRRGNLKVSIDGEELTASEAARRIGIKKSTMLYRIHSGWSGHDLAKAVR